MSSNMQNIKNNLVNIPGWNTKRKIVVFESDDWGMIRMASKEAFERLKSKGYPVDQCVYNQFDSLENNDDVIGLMDVLSSVRDQNGNPAKFTLNNIVANPDFKKIKENHYESYYYEPFTESLSRNNHSDQVVPLYLEGINQNIFQMQFHGREHVNVNRWMSELQNSNKILLDAFEEQMFTVASGNSTSGRRDFLDAFGMAYSKEFESMESIIRSGTQLFHHLWGYNSLSFIAPCYVWSTDIEPILASSGIRYLQGTHVQIVPKEGLVLKAERKYHYQGQKGNNQIRYLIRNAHFEPAAHQNGAEEIVRTMKQIETAFFWRKPAIISSHRVNYIGSIESNNRSHNLLLLKELLRQITNKYPDVLFMSTDQLGSIIANKICVE